jgi:hypothetical protein
MGVDISDFNNDGNLDVFQVDMDAKDNRRKKANMSSMNPKLFWDVVDAGFNYQYMHNCMQLNTGVNENGIPHFGNGIAYYRNFLYRLELGTFIC